MDIETILHGARAVLSLLIAVLLGEAVRVLTPALWRRALTVLPAAMVIVCAAVSAYYLIVFVALCQQLNIFQVADSGTLQHTLIVPQIVLGIASAIVFWQLRLKRIGVRRSSLIELASFSLDEQRASLASSQQLTDAIASAIQSLFVQSQISERERREAISERDAALRQVDELRVILNQVEKIRFELHRQLMERGQ